MKRYIIEIIYALAIILISYMASSNLRKTGAVACDVTNYETYINTKVWCDIIDWDDVRIPDNYLVESGE